jgi:multidrug efflux pump subunit AcrA (membrane-fusion protein)
VLLAGCNKAESAGKPAEGGAGEGPPPMPVEVAVARTDTVVDAILATGQIEAVQSIELRPEVEGRVAEILVREGAYVAQGTPLFKVDDAELRAQVARAEADLVVSRYAARLALAGLEAILGRRLFTNRDVP